MTPQALDLADLVLREQKVVRVMNASGAVLDVTISSLARRDPGTRLVEAFARHLQDHGGLPDMTKSGALFAEAYRLTLAGGHWNAIYALAANSPCGC